jgi:hypothetical protein
MAVALLKLYAERYYGQPRTQFFAVRPAQFEYCGLLPFYREPRLLSRWLTTEANVGDAGQRCALSLIDGGRVSGEVLAVTGWEVQLSWEEIAGCLGLKGFSLGPAGRAICIHGSSWCLDADSAAALERAFGVALERLATELQAVSSPAPLA